MPAVVRVRIYVLGAQGIIELADELAGLDGDGFLLLHPAVCGVGDEAEVLGMLCELLQRELEGMLGEFAFGIGIAVVDAEGVEIAGDDEQRLLVLLEALGIGERLLERRHHAALALLGLVQVDVQALLLDEHP